MISSLACPAAVSKNTIVSRNTEGVEGLKVRIPTKPAMHSNMKPAIYSNPKPVGVPI